MVAGVFDELARERPRRRFTIGINDDVSGTSLTTTRRSTSSRPTRSARSSSASARTARSARTRTRSRSSAPRRACTRRATSSTTRRSPARRRCRTCASGRSRSGRPTSCSRRASSAATSSGCSSRSTCSAARRPARRCCSTAAHPPDEVWDALPRPVQEQILAKQIDVYAIDAGRIAREAGLAGRINIVLQTCFFAISGVLPREEAIERIKAAIAKTYGRRGAEVVERNQAAVDRALDGPAPGRGARAGDGDPRAAAGRARARARVRPHRHRGDDGRPRRRAAGQRAAGRRHLPERHDGVREAQHLRAGRRLGRRPLHPVRQLQLRLPAQRDPLQVLRPVRAWTARRTGSGRRRSTRVGLPDARYTLQVYVEDCTGCGLCVEACPVVGARRPGAQGDQPRAARAAGRRRAREHRVLRDAAGERPVPRRLRHGARHPVPGAAVRVLRRLRGLRRDAVPQAALAAVRRPADGRQRDRLLVDLRRQPADHAVDDRRRRARPGLVELAVRGQRRVRARLPARRRPAHRARPPAPRRAARRGRRRSWWTRSSTRRSCASRSCARSASGWRS